MGDDYGFSVVKKKGQRGRNKASMAGKMLQSKANENEDFNSEKFHRQFNSCLQDVRLSNFFHESFEIIIEELRALWQPEVLTSASQHIHATENIDLLCYGLGNFSSCPIARYQLCLLVLLCEKLADRCLTCLVYDPVFTNSEIDILNQFGFKVLPENEEGRYVCLRPTLAFLPHCGKALYNNLIWSNLKVTDDQRNSQLENNSGQDNLTMEAGLPNLVLIGNSFSKMVERTLTSELKKTGNYIIKINPHMKEVPLPVTFVHTDVFNDLAVHSFPKKQLLSAAKKLCTDLTEPVYADEDVEFIRKNTTVK